MSLRAAPNHPSTMPFVEAVGKLMQNFGLIEFQTHEWIALLQEDSMVGELAKHSKLRDRVAIIIKMIDRSSWIPEDVKLQCKEVWEKVQPHAELRNIVAHAPVVMGFPNADPSETATVSGVLNLKPKNGSKEAELVSVQEILGSVNATFTIGEKLLAGRSIIRRLREGAA